MSFLGFRKSVIVILTFLWSRQMKAIFKIPLYTNAINLTLANIMISLTGFVFWILAARFYSPQEVGKDSAVISSVALLSILSSLGLGYGLLRYLNPRVNFHKLIDSSITLVGLLSLAVAVIYIIGLRFWSPALLFIQHDPFYMLFYIFLVPATALYGLVDHALMAGRKADFVLIKSFVFNGSRLLLLIFMTEFFNFLGIFGAWSFATIIALGIGIFWLLPRVYLGYRALPAINRKVVATIIPFAISNYFSDLFWLTPGLVLPIIIINQLNAESNAYFYIAWGISNVITLIPASVSISLLVEGTYDEGQLKTLILRSFKMIVILLVPVVIAVWLLTDKLLLLYGNPYVQNAGTLLHWLIISAFPCAINTVYFGVQRVKKNLKPVIVLTALTSVVAITISYVLLIQIGINGVGIAWFAGQSLVALIILVKNVLQSR
jgi:O-antigen/teichoic acid export membrane protein